MPDSWMSRIVIAQGDARNNNSVRAFERHAMHQQDVFSTAAHSTVIAVLETTLGVAGEKEPIRRKVVGDWLRHRGDVLVQRFQADRRTEQFATLVDVDRLTCIYVTVEVVPAPANEWAVGRWLRRLRGGGSRRFLVKYRKVKSTTKSVNEISS